MRPLGILVTGDPVDPVVHRRGSFVDLFRSVLAGAFEGEILVRDARRGERFVARELSTLVITGSPESVTSRATWIVEAERSLAALVSDGVPTLGVCFGHQLLVQALGGRVELNPNGREMGTVPLRLLADEDPLLAGLPAPATANMSHVDSATKLPAGAEVLAASELDPHALVRFGERALGMQFHPEFDRGVMRGYVEARRDVLAAEGIDPERVPAADAPFAVELLRRFVGAGVRR
jgi:GMP synthase (glutamine-hydrolysing)